MLMGGEIHTQVIPVSTISTLPTTVPFTCVCGNTLPLEIVGGQYQDEYRGRCEGCGRVWVLTEISEIMEEREADEEE
jgi:hypothetical protein